MTRRPRSFMVLSSLVAWLAGSAPVLAADAVLPKHVTPRTLQAVRQGLDYLARSQSSDGAWHEDSGGEAYPITMTSLAGMAMLAHGHTPTRGKYAPNLENAIGYLLDRQRANGIITGPNEEMGRPMYGHGFSMMFLASVHGSITKESTRVKVREMIRKGITLTARGQSNFGGWTYTPGDGDEGSVTVTQVQALRAARNAGFLVPSGTIEESIRYLEKCQTPEGGIRYSLFSGGGSRLPISAAACATLYNAGEYDSPLAEKCLNYVWKNFESKRGWAQSGHDFYAHLYSAQAFYMAGDKYWDIYFPAIRDDLIRMQASDGSWNGDGIGKTYGTSIALIILQLPYKFCPVFQR